MASSPKKYSSDFKVKVALEAIKGQKTLNEISSEYGVHTTQITQWKKQMRGSNCHRSSHVTAMSEPRAKKPSSLPYIKKSVSSKSSWIS
ncbi:hypothetical protein KSD_59760 [Ktedonobacter sp. SOSP1-85]|nr:hypothetical protein KSD_59760 [Ktedonobacter sp. SOSP1-85]